MIETGNGSGDVPKPQNGQVRIETQCVRCQRIVVIEADVDPLFASMAETMRRVGLVCSECAQAVASSSRAVRPVATARAEARPRYADD